MLPLAPPFPAAWRLHDPQCNGRCCAGRPLTRGPSQGAVSRGRVRYRTGRADDCVTINDRLSRMSGTRHFLGRQRYRADGILAGSLGSPTKSRSPSLEFIVTESLLQMRIAKWPPVLAARFLGWWHSRARASSEGPSLSAMLRRSRGSPFAAASNQVEARGDRGGDSDASDD